MSCIIFQWMKWENAFSNMCTLAYSLSHLALLWTKVDNVIKGYSAFVYIPALLVDNGDILPIEHVMRQCLHVICTWFSSCMFISMELYVMRQCISWSKKCNETVYMPIGSVWYCVKWSRTTNGQLTASQTSNLIWRSSARVIVVTTVLQEKYIYVWIFSSSLSARCALGMLLLVTDKDKAVSNTSRLTK